MEAPDLTDHISKRFNKEIEDLRLIVAIIKTIADL